MQNLPAGVCLPQAGHTVIPCGTAGVTFSPHTGQNLAPSGRAAPHAAHTEPSEGAAACPCALMLAAAVCPNPTVPATCWFAGWPPSPCMIPLTCGIIAPMTDRPTPKPSRSVVIPPPEPPSPEPIWPMPAA